MKALRNDEHPILTGEAGRAAQKRGKYIYAFVPATAGPITPDSGIEGERIFTVAHGKTAAVVSDVPPTARLRPERRHLEAHNRVIKQLLAAGTVLPLAFGTVVRSHAALRRVLAVNGNDLESHLHRLHDKVEMGLRVTWDVPNIFEYFVQMHPELRAARDRLLGQRHVPTQDDKIEVGRLFEQTLAADRETYAGIAENALSDSCLEFKRNRCRTEHEVMNVACLVERNAQSRFEAAMLAAAQLFDNNFAFDYNGPWAPYSFVNLTLKR